MAKQTEGPWEVNYYPDSKQPHSICIDGDLAKKVLDVRGWGYLTGGGDICKKLTNDEAIEIQNRWANLAAAAPDMLEVLEFLVTQSQELQDKGMIRNRDADECFIKAKNAIAKAKGE